MRKIVLTLALLFAAGSTHSAEEDKTVVRDGQFSDDIYVAGERVKITADAEGDVIVAGGNIKIEGRIAGDVLAAGGEVSVEAELADDIRIAGGQINVCSQIDGDATFAGGDINLCSQSVVRNHVWVAAGEANIEGQILRDLTVYAGHITLAGEVIGNVKFEGESIELLPNAIIQGDLEYRSPNPVKVHEGARVIGEERYTMSESSWWGGKWTKGNAKSFAKFAVSMLLIGVVSMLVTAVVLAYFFPGSIKTTRTIIRTRILPSLGVGVVAALVLPIVMILLAMTVIGIPLALILMLLYILMIIAGFYVSLLFISHEIHKKFQGDKPKTTLWKILSILLSAILIVLISLIPVIGSITILLVYLAGIGAVCLFLIESRKHQHQISST